MIYVEIRKLLKKLFKITVLSTRFAVLKPTMFLNVHFLVSFTVKLTSDCTVHHRGRWLSIIAKSVNAHDILNSGHQACERQLSLFCNRGAHTK